MRYLLLVLLLSAALCAQTPPLAEPGKSGAVQSVGSGQTGPDWLGVRRAPARTADPPVPQWRLLPSESDAKPPFSRWKLFLVPKVQKTPSTAPILLSDTVGAEPRWGHTLQGKNYVITQQKQLCAIPLTNVLPPSGTSPTIRRVPIPDAQFFPMKEVQPPAPSCDDWK
jgi:hypothetical protein